MSAATTVVVMQPYFLPYRAYYGLIRKADVFVVFDDVQFCRGWQQRNQILAPDGTKCWITVPVQSSRPRRQRIDEVRIYQEEAWEQLLLARIRHCYGGHPWFGEIYPELAGLLERPAERLVELTVSLLRWSAARIGLPLPEWTASSKLGGHGLPASERLAHICMQLRATHYLSGPAARAYLDTKLFEQIGIQVVWHEDTYAAYPQRGTQTFDPWVSILDLLMNCGPDSVRYV